MSALFSNPFFNIPFITWIFLFLIYFVPAISDILDMGDQYFNNVLWFFYLVPTLLLVFKKGTKYGVLTTGIGSILFLLIELLESDGIGKQEIITIVEILIVNILISVLLGNLVKRTNEEQDQLEENKQKYYSLFKYNPNIIASLDLSGKILSVNRRFEDSISNTKELIGKPFLSIVSQKDKDLVKNSLDRVTQTIDSVPYEFHLINQTLLRVIHIPIIVKGEIVGIHAVCKDFTAEKITELKLVESENRYKTLVEMSPDIIAVHANEKVLFMNETGLSFLQVSDETKDIHLRSFLTRDLDYFKSKANQTPDYVEVQIRSGDGTIYEMEYTSKPIDFNGEKVKLVKASNISERKHMERALKESEEKYKNLIENAFVGFYLIQNNELVYVNQWFTHILGLSEQELLGTNFIEHIHDEDKKRILINFQKLIDGEKTFLIDEIQTSTQAQTAINLELQASLTQINGSSAIIGIAIDVTDKKKANAKIEYIAYHDSLTKLHNMNYLNHYLPEEFEESKDKEIPICMMFFNLDRFKLINDSYGHRIGDQLLKMVSKRLLNLGGNVIRAGGDEFILYLHNMNPKQAEDLAKILLEKFSEPFYLEKREIRIAASIGITNIQPDDSLEDALQKASSALHFAKEFGRNQFQFYSSEFGKIANRRLILEQELRKALENEELEVFYQPKLDLFTSQITGMEALIRWNNPILGAVSPEEFIPIAEETGMILSLGKWVLETACHQNREWQNDRYHPLHVCVNISSRQFLQDDFVYMIEQILNKSGLSPKYLNLEITEGIALYNINDAIKKLKQLKQLGVSISLDDFGTGYSSLSYIKSLPIDFLKIDRSFIIGILKNQDSAIIDAIISMAHSLGFRVVAEGVEDQQQLRTLKEMGCDEIQGYYLAKPMSSDGFKQFLNRYPVKS